MSKMMIAGDMPAQFNPDYKTCRWCRAPSAACQARIQKIESAIAADFEDVTEVPLVPPDTGALGKAFAVLPFIQLWTKAVEKEVALRVAAGENVIGRDEKPLKFVEGREGKRVWKDKALAEQMLVASPLIGPTKAYEPAEIITAPAAAKILNKKKTIETWKVFESNIHRAPGKPVLALGSDERPAFTGNIAAADDFEDLSDV